MTVARAGQGAVLLENGEVLVAGAASSTGVTATAELYNPSTATFTATRRMNDARELSQLTLLRCGASLLTRLAGGDSGVAVWPLPACGRVPHGSPAEAAHARPSA
jgi:hypothetical protein